MLWNKSADLDNFMSKVSDWIIFANIYFRLYLFTGILKKVTTYSSSEESEDEDPQEPAPPPPLQPQPQIKSENGHTEVNGKCEK